MLSEIKARNVDGHEMRAGVSFCCGLSIGSRDYAKKRNQWNAERTRYDFF